MKCALFWALNPGPRRLGFNLPGVLILLTLLAISPLSAMSDEGGRLFFDKAWKTYLSETVRRGFPLVPSVPQTAPKTLPFWPGLDRQLTDARDMGAGPDLDVLSSWCLFYQLQGHEALENAEKAWLKGRTFQINPLWVGVTYLRCLRFMGKTQQMTAAWNHWEQKYRSPEALLEGLEGLEVQDDPQTFSLLRQAVQLYPGDRRFFSLMLLFRKDFPQIDPLVRRDMRDRGGFDSLQLRQLIRRLAKDPENRKAVLTLLWEVGARSRDLQLAASLEALTDSAPLLDQGLDTEDYRLWCRYWASHPNESSSAGGTYSWDTGAGGGDSAWVNFENGRLSSWGEGYKNWNQGAFQATFSEGKLLATVDRAGDSVWRMTWETYPYLQEIQWAKGDEKIVYTYEPFTVAQPLFEDEKSKALPVFLPLNLRQPHALPGLTVDKLLPLALRKNSFKGTKLIQQLYLYQGEVWMGVEDTNEDGHPDTWYFYRNGQLDSVYRNFDWSGSSTVAELYKNGKLHSVLADPERTGKTDFVLFPQSGMELWDGKDRGLPVLRVVSWNGGHAKVVVFSRKEPPFLTMPAWPVFTWP